eukprot:12999751-Alexandrium_andersonii.AAC.1
MASCDTRIGRAMFRGTTKVTGVRDPEGTLRTAPSEMDQVLWDSRAAIWDTSPPLPPAAADLLSSYFARRQCPVPPAPRPTWRATLAV